MADAHRGILRVVDAQAMSDLLGLPCDRRTPVLTQNGAALLPYDIPANEVTLRELRSLTPVPLPGFDTDNDTVFVNETVRDHCLAEGIAFIRCRSHRKNDQAHV